MEDGGSRGPNGLRAFVAIIGIAVPLGPGFVSGCGTSATVTTSPPSTTADASIHLVSVVTGGGGGAAPSSGAPIINPFGGSSSSGGPSNGGSSSGAQSSSGASSSGVGSSSGAFDSGPPTDDASEGGSSSGNLSDAAVESGPSSEGGSSSGGSSSSGGPDASTNVCSAYTAPVCGAGPCDLRSNTCCISLTLQARCIPGAQAACNTNEATIHCLQACECTGGDVCCGVDNTLVGVVQSACQAVPNGGFCSPHPQTATQAAAQLCKQTSECKNGEACIAQTCIYGAMLSICGLQSQAPFNCH